MSYQKKQSFQDLLDSHFHGNDKNGAFFKGLDIIKTYRISSITDAIHSVVASQEKSAALCLHNSGVWLLVAERRSRIASAHASGLSVLSNLPVPCVTISFGPPLACAMTGQPLARASIKVIRLANAPMKVQARTRVRAYKLFTVHTQSPAKIHMFRDAQFLGKSLEIIHFFTIAYNRETKIRIFMNYPGKHFQEKIDSLEP